VYPLTVKFAARLCGVVVPMDPAENPMPVCCGAVVCAGSTEAAASSAIPTRPRENGWPCGKRQPQPREKASGGSRCAMIFAVIWFTRISPLTWRKTVCNRRINTKSQYAVRAMRAAQVKLMVTVTVMT